MFLSEDSGKVESLHEFKDRIEKLELNKKLSDENFGLLLKLYEKKENENTQLRQQLEELRRQSESEK